MKGLQKKNKSFLFHFVKYSLFRNLRDEGKSLKFYFHHVGVFNHLVGLYLGFFFFERFFVFCSDDSLKSEIIT